MRKVRMDLCNPWIVPCKVAINTLCNKAWICCAFHGLSAWYFAQSMDQADEVSFYFEVTAYTFRSCIAVVTASLYSHRLHSFNYIHIQSLNQIHVHLQVANIVDINIQLATQLLNSLCIDYTTAVQHMDFTLISQLACYLMCIATRTIAIASYNHIVRVVYLYSYTDLCDCLYL